MIWFAQHVLGMPLDPWQQWLVIHLGELLPDGRPRFRQVLVLVARQNGKTHLCMVLTLFWLFAEKQGLVFGTSTSLEQAAEPWEAACTVALASEALSQYLAKDAIRKTNGQQSLRTTERCAYKIGAVSPRGGRGKSIDRIVGDELREHRTWVGYNASFNAMNARPFGQAVFISNMGDARSVVLNSLRSDALSVLEGGPGDPRIGIFEWSAVAGTHPMDVDGWALANPQLGRRMDYDTIRGPALRVSKPGADPEELAGFMTEMLCVDVPVLDPAIDAAAWAAGNQPAPIDLALRRRLAAVVDVSPDFQHVSLTVGLEIAPGVVRGEVVAAWDSVDACLAELPDWVAKIRPRVVGWFPGGPAAVLDAQLRDRRKTGRRKWPPANVLVQEITTEAPAAAMAFAERVSAGGFLHSGQALLDAQALGAEKLPMPGERWTFVRSGTGHVDALYAMAGVVHLARTMPATLGKPRVIRSTSAGRPS